MLRGLFELCGLGFRPARPARSLGEAGEEIAAAWLASRGLIILARNLRIGSGELDIVAREGPLGPSGRVVFIEVKTRSDCGDQRPAEAVDAAKQRRLRSAAAAWLFEMELRGISVRYDVVEVLVPAEGEPRLRWLQGAFDEDGPSFC